MQVCRNAQLLASRQFGVAVICRWFWFRRLLVGESGRATYAISGAEAWSLCSLRCGIGLEQWRQGLGSTAIARERRLYYVGHGNQGAAARRFRRPYARLSNANRTGVIGPSRARRLEICPQCLVVTVDGCR